jgi:O-antigen/teichoic acid export membrane protein
VRFFLGAFINPEAVAYFSISSKLPMLIQSFVSNAISVLFPHVSSLAATDTKSKIVDQYTRSNRLVLIVSMLGFGFLALTSYLVLSLWVGEEIARIAALPTVILCVRGFLSSMTNVPSNFALGVGHSNWVAHASIGYTVALLILGYALTVFFGVAGLCIGLALSELVGIIYLKNRIQKYLEVPGVGRLEIER